MASFSALASRLQGTKDLPLTLLSLDPGKTTGYAIFTGYNLREQGQLDTSSIPLGAEAIRQLMDEFIPELIVVEDYRVYSWRAKQHIFSDLHTSRLIGSIETLCVVFFLPPPTKQMAGTVKQFCSDKRLKEWDFWVKGQPHARDAIRHGCYFILFGKHPNDSNNK